MMIECQNCGKKIVDTMGSCPGCGEIISVINLLGQIFNKDQIPNGVWFYKYPNGDINLGVTMRSKKISLMFIFIMILAFGSTAFLIRPPFFERGELLYELSLLPAYAIVFFVLSILLLICITPYLIFLPLMGKQNFHIGSRSYAFRGLGKIGSKKYFDWNDIKKVKAEKIGMLEVTLSNGGSRIYLQGTKNIRINVFNWIGTEKLDFLVKSLNYLIETDCKVNRYKVEKKG